MYCLVAYGYAYTLYFDVGCWTVQFLFLYGRITS
jgi:hypothetical protein